MTSLNLKFSILVLTAIALGAAEQVDLSVVNKIKAEAFSNSKVMDTMFYLTDVYGPRLTNNFAQLSGGRRLGR